MKIAIEGCAHGELEKIYTVIGELERQNNFKVDLLLMCGDFQSVRNPADLETMSVPPKYRSMGSFHEYYSGKKVAPILTIFIGGNHEASNYLGELFYGGWAAPNIYYLGNAGVLEFNGVRIGGLSGIFKQNDFNKGHYEHFPFNEGSKKSVYHVRNVEVHRLKLLRQPMDIFLTHDWPRGIYNHGDVGPLLQKKQFFKEEIESNTLGSRPAETLLEHLRPSYWFSAHLHCKFAALVNHPEKDGKPESQTRFLALDKCLPKRNFLQIIDIEAKETDDNILKYDLEWLTVLKNTNDLTNVEKGNNYIADTPYVAASSAEDISKLFSNNLAVPLNFTQTVPLYEDPNAKYTYNPQINHQTTELCSKLSITDPLKCLLERAGIDTQEAAEESFQSAYESFINPDESVAEEKTDEQEVDMELGFVIDKKGMSQKQIDYFLSPQEQPPKQPDFPEFNSSLTPIAKSPSVNKTFKRRNASLYQNKED